MKFNYSGKIILFILVISSNVLLGQIGSDCPAEVIVPIEPLRVECPSSEYEVIMYDEFEGTELNPEYWRKVGPNDAPADRVFEHPEDNDGNIRLTYSDPDNVIVEDGKAKLRLVAEPAVYDGIDADGNPFHFEFPFSGANLERTDPADNPIYHVLFETKFKIPKGFNLWPAWWTWNHQEVDFLEIFGTQNSEFQVNIHDFAHNPVVNCNGYYLFPYGFYDQFVEMKGEITRTWIKVWLDNELIVTIPKFTTMLGEPVLLSCGETAPAFQEYTKKKAFPKGDAWFGHIFGITSTSDQWIAEGTMEIEYAKLSSRRNCESEFGIDSKEYSESQTLSGNKSIKWNIVIKDGAVLTIKNANFKFASNKSIVIEEGGKLILDNATLTDNPECELKWEGIKAYSTTKSAEIFVRTPSTIENAVRGIVFNNSHSIGSILDVQESLTIQNNNLGIGCKGNGATIKVEDTNFLNNGVGIGLEASKNISVKNSLFDGNEMGIKSLNAHANIGGGNVFQNGEFGIYLSEYNPMSSGMLCGSADEDPNTFQNMSHAAIMCLGATHPLGLQVVNNIFENLNSETYAAIEVIGLSNLNISNNGFENCYKGINLASTSNVIYSPESKIRCNIFSNITYGDVWITGNNGKTTFLGNDHSEGEHILDYLLWDATVNPDIGSATNPAGNCFSSYVGIVFNQTNTTPSSFNYTFEDNPAMPCYEPQNSIYFNSIKSNAISDQCTGHIGPFDGLVGDGPIWWGPSNPQTWCPQCIIDAIATTIDTYVLTGGDDPRTVGIESTAYTPELEAQKELMDQKINYGLYTALRVHDMQFADDILSGLESHYWKKLYYGLKLMEGKEEEARVLLDELAQSAENSDFVVLQELNLKISYDLSEGELLDESDIAIIDAINTSRSTLIGHNASMSLRILGELPENPYQGIDPFELPAERQGQKLANDFITIHPNPTADYLKITLNDNSIDNGQISIFDLTGKKLLLQQFNNGQSIDLSHLDRGIYFIEIYNNGIVAATDKLIISR